MKFSKQDVRMKLQELNYNQHPNLSAFKVTTIFILGTQPKSIYSITFFSFIKLLACSLVPGASLEHLF